MDKNTIEPVAYIRTDFKDKFGIPRQSGLVGELTARVVFVPKYRNPDALRGIEGFSHLWPLFGFSKALRKTWSPTVRPPRLGGNKRIGVFASRSPFHPNGLGLSSVALLRVETTADEGDVLIVSGADLLDMTPIYDIKPYIPYADMHPEASGGYTDEIPRERLLVEFPDDLLCIIPEDKRKAVLGCIAEDPRPSYQDDSGRVYGMRFAEFDIRFTVRENVAEVIDVQTIS